MWHLSPSPLRLRKPEEAFDIGVLQAKAAGDSKVPSALSIIVGQSPRGAQIPQGYGKCSLFGSLRNAWYGLRMQRRRYNGDYVWGGNSSWEADPIARYLRTRVLMTLIVSSPSLATNAARSSLQGQCHLGEIERCEKLAPGNGAAGTWAGSPPEARRWPP